MKRTAAVVRGRGVAQCRSLVGLAVCIGLGIFAILLESQHTSDVFKVLSISYQNAPYYSKISSDFPSSMDHNDQEFSEDQSLEEDDGDEEHQQTIARKFPRIIMGIPFDSITLHSNNSSQALVESSKYISAEFNPLSKTKDSSARLYLNHHPLHNPQRKTGLSMLPSIHSVETAINTNASLLGHQTITYSERQREWHKDCVPVFNEPKGSDPTPKTTRIVARSTCNVFHELNLLEAHNELATENSSGSSNEKNSTMSMPQKRGARIELLGEGSWRSVWKLTEDNTVLSAANNHTLPKQLVLKLLLWNREYNEESFGLHQTDAIAMEALRASKYVANSYGFCGQSVVTELGMGNAKSAFKSKSLRGIDRLRLARDLARGLTDIHALKVHAWNQSEEHGSDRTENRTATTKGAQSQGGTMRWRPLVFAHHDINPANLIRAADGGIRWNDFNLGLINRRYSTHNSKGSSNKNDKYSSECPVPVLYQNDLWRSPEECANFSNGTLFLDKDRDGHNTASQAADVYSLGNLLFYILTKHQPWTHLEEEPITKQEIGLAKTQGRLPNLPDRYLERPTAKTLWKAIQMCYTYDPMLRPDAWEIAEFLEASYQKHKGKGTKRGHLKNPTSSGS